MKNRIRLLMVCVLWAATNCSLLQAQPADTGTADGVETAIKSGLFDQVADALESSYYQKDFRENQLPAVPPYSIKEPAFSGLDGHDSATVRGSHLHRWLGAYRDSGQGNERDSQDRVRRAASV